MPGLADANCYSLRDSSGRYLRHYNYALRVDPYQNTETFLADSSFTVVSPWT